MTRCNEFKTLEFVITFQRQKKPEVTAANCAVLPRLSPGHGHSPVNSIYSCCKAQPYWCSTEPTWNRKRRLILKQIHFCHFILQTRMVYSKPDKLNVASISKCQISTNLKLFNWTVKSAQKQMRYNNKK